MITQERFERIERATDLPIAILALLTVPALILEERANSVALRELALGLNWIVWAAFCAEYVGKLVFAPSRIGYARRAWLDLAIIVLSPPFLPSSLFQATRTFRALRSLRLLRFVRLAAIASIGIREAGEAFRHRRFHLVTLTTAVVVGVGALGIFAAESGQNNNINSLGDAFWWAIVTATTVGYGDVSPVTSEGRVIAVVLMIVGIGFIGVFTATITSFFLEPAVQPDSRSIEDRLDRIEAQLEEILSRQQSKAA